MATEESASAAAKPAPAPWIRGAVRDVLERTPQYRSLSAADQQQLARSMVRVSALAADLIAEEGHAQGEIERGPSREAPLARAQDAQPAFGAAADRVSGQVRATLEAVSFPRFVTDLINGVFRAMIDSNQQQMQQYLQLLNAVSASADGFARTQFGLPQVRQWVADHFPESVEYEQPDPDDEPDPDEIAAVRLRLRGGASMPSEDDIRATLGIPDQQSVAASNPEQLVPLARRYLAQQRQQMLSTMVQMGMQRIVVEGGRINAAMRFHVDTRSAANQDRGSEFSMQNRVRAAGKFGVGPWGASAEIENNIGYVSTERSQHTEEMNTDVELNSSVEINFRSDYLPLNQMAGPAQAERIRAGSLNPTAETDPAVARASRMQAQLASESTRRDATARVIDTARTPMAERAALDVPTPGAGAAVGVPALPTRGAVPAPTPVPASTPAQSTVSPVPPAPTVTPAAAPATAPATPVPAAPTAQPTTATASPPPSPSRPPAPSTAAAPPAPVQGSSQPTVATPR